MANQTEQQINISISENLNGLDNQLPILSFLKRPKNTNPKKSLNSKQYEQQNCEYQIEVINHKIVEKQFTIYQIKVTYGSLYWIFQTRYSLLEGLHSKLNKDVIHRLTKFPEKRLFGNMDQNFVLKRKIEINQYLKSLIQYGKNEKPVKDFIKQSQKAAIEINDPCELKHFKLDL
ncbi:unnamed protein product [Paramecium primaurelia]|uniref:PX domain-containing protein n=2 Tax=Paramecium TaxID=5884 RepID=A0A8S1JTP0_PARPR|nr:unnamed protein product [Paramecium primaurelia]CAD8044971.1 unnamed protein product [Paramecium primaurelia]CAD8139257.1 unnamed protein product [Paramecium pentaurelia]